MKPSLRAAIFARANGRCEYCRITASVLVGGLVVDHVVPRQHGGPDDAANLAAACDRCNLYKGTNLSSIDPESREHVRLFNPRADRWEQSFTIAAGVIRGQTASGRATVALLRMNAAPRVDLRKKLDGFGL